MNNYRPLSLTNCDYKILTFVFAKRLGNVLDSIINFDQVAYLKERYIGTSIRNILDLYEYCESSNSPGALLLMDFEKAYDSLEHRFIISVLKKFNFGQTFIEWFKLLYNDARFMVKNNGWLSKSYKMNRGLRQGCALSSLIFIINVEILAIMLRQNKNINGIFINQTEHKLVQYADDLTVSVRDTQSVHEVLNVINNFSKCSGLCLNYKKTKGIWLGSLKDLGYRQFSNVTWTGKPVKCLGVYIGHNKEQCYKLNWGIKLEKIEKLLQNWWKRRLTLYGKVHVIKTFALSKIVFNASVMTVPDDIKNKLNSLFYYFLWGKRDKIKRKSVIKKTIEGGLNMIDVDSFMLALKAAWVNRLQNSRGKWADVFKMYVQKMSCSVEYLWKMSFRKIENFPLLTVLPQFYQDVLLAFNKCKYIKPFELLSDHEILEQPLWGNEYFKIKDTCLFIKGWSKNNILYVKDVVNENGRIMTDVELYNLNIDKTNALQSIFILKNYVLKKIKECDLSLAHAVKIKNLMTIVYLNKRINISSIKSKLYYEIILRKICNKGNMESIFAREFKFKNRTDIWKNVYKQKTMLSIPKLNEFNFKILNNIVPCGKVLSKWNKDISEKCEYCNETETTKHMLYDCKRVQNIWKNVSSILRVNVTWKNVVCGFINVDITPKIRCLNYIFSIIVYAIFKENSYCKFNNTSYGNSNLRAYVKQNIIYYKLVLNVVDSSTKRFNMIDDVIKSI